MSGSTFRLFYWPGACSLAPHTVLEEFGEKFEAVPVDLGKQQQRSGDFLKLNPKGRVPVLVHGDFILTENPAILRYLARHRPELGLWPEDQRGDARCAEFLSWIASTVHATYSHVTRPDRYVDEDDAKLAVKKKGKDVTMGLWADIEHSLKGKKWVLGDKLSVADFYLLVVWTWARNSAFYANIHTDLPNWSAHARTMGERPGVGRAFAREGIRLPSEI